MKIKIETDRHEVSKDWIVRVLGYELIGLKANETVRLATGSHADLIVASSFALRAITRELDRARDMLLDFGAREDVEMLDQLDGIKAAARAAREE